MQNTEEHRPCLARPSVAVRTQQLRQCFQSNVAVESLDLAIAAGEIYGFLGPNGAGKSTVVRMLCTLLRPSAGRALVAGFDVVGNPQAVRLRIGVALQGVALDLRQTGRELLTMQGRLYGMSTARIRQRLSEVLDFVRIGSAIDQGIATYSGGMKRRLDLAASLIHDPAVLFLDEPTTGLDPLSRAAVWSEIRHLNEELGMTIFLTTQYLEEADTLCDRVGILSQGRLVAEGSPSTLKRSIGRDLIVAEVEGHDPGAVAELQGLPSLSSVQWTDGQVVLTTEDGPAALQTVALALSRTSLRVKALTLRTPTLDDVFMDLTGASMRRAVR